MFGPSSREGRPVGQTLWTVSLGAVLNLASAAATGVIIAVVARSVSHDLFGLLAIGMTVALVGTDLLDRGCTEELVRLTARGEPGTRALTYQLLRAKLAWSPILLMVLVGIGWIGSGGVRGYLLWFWLYAMLYMTWRTLLCPIRAQARLGSVALYGIQERIVALAVVVLGIRTLGPASFPLGLSAGAATVCVRLAFVRGWGEGPPSIELTRLGTAARPLAVAALTKSGQLFDVAIVSAVAGSAMGGLLAGATRLIAPLNTVTVQVGHLVFARAATPTGLSRRQAMYVVGATAVVCLPLLGVLCWQSERVVGFTLGPSYAPIAPLFATFAIGVTLTVFTTPIVAWMQARGAAVAAAGASGVSLAVFFVVLVVGAASQSLPIVATAYPVQQAVLLCTLAGRMCYRWWKGRRRPVEPTAVQPSAAKLPGQVRPPVFATTESPYAKAR